MRNSKLLMISMIILGLQLGCKPRTSADANLPTLTSPKAKAGDTGKNLGAEEEDGDLENGEQLDPEAIATPEETFAKLQDEIQVLKNKLAENENVSAAQKADMIKKIEDLEKTKLSLEAEIKAAKDKNTALEKQVNTKPAGSSSQSTVGLSGYPYCGTAFYGTIFTCGGGYSCAKSDPQYQNICELSNISRAGSIYPSCGTGAVYGSVFTCNGNRRCAKSNPNLSDASICVLP